MNIDMTKTLKDLRKKKDVTQEQLANHLGISAQSVGKWERGEGFPDITLLPKISMYFAITVDDLLGVGEAKIKAAVDEYADESIRLNNIGETEKDLDLWERAYTEFPCNENVKRGLMHALFHAYYDRNTDVSARIILLGEDILENSKDTDIRESAIQLLCYTYNKMKNKENAKKYANMMGEYCTSCYELLKIVLDGEEAVERCQHNMVELFDLIAGNAYVMSWKGNYSSEEKIRINKFCINLFALIYEDEDYGFYTCRLSQYYKNIADEYAKLGKVDECLDALESMKKFAIITDNQLDFIRTSFMVNKTEYNRCETSKNYTENECGVRLKGLKNKVFDSVREEERFKMIIEELKKYAN